MHNEQILISKIRVLPPERLREVEDFIDFLRQASEDRQLRQAAAKLSEDALMDTAYTTLRKITFLHTITTDKFANFPQRLPLHRNPIKQFFHKIYIAHFLRLSSFACFSSAAMVFR
jgi:hypothetical protein